MQAPEPLPYSGRGQGIERREQGSSVVSKHKEEACVQAKACPMIASEALRLWGQRFTPVAREPSGLDCGH